MWKLLYWIVPLLTATTTALQPQSSPVTSDLSALLASEQASYTQLQYTQHYTDREGNLVTYSGVLYLNVTSFSAKDCKLKIAVVVQDRFSGTEEKRGRFRTTTSNLGEKIVTYRYTYALDLADTPDAHFSPLMARPSQLSSGTAFACEEDNRCRVEWLHLTTNDRKVRETETTDNLLNVDQDVNDVNIPITSPANATKIADGVLSLISSCSRPSAKIVP